MSKRELSTHEQKLQSCFQKAVNKFKRATKNLNDTIRDKNLKINKYENFIYYLKSKGRIEENEVPEMMGSCIRIELYDEGGFPITEFKRKFDSYFEAQFVANSMNAKTKQTKKVIPYHCEHCDKFHVGRSHSTLKESEKEEYKNKMSEINIDDL
jgi:hypothetical protein